MAAFTGSTNRILGRAGRLGEPFGIVETGAGTIEVRFKRGIANGQPVEVMIRPENVQLGTENGSVGRVVRASFMGIQTNYEVDAFGSRIEVVEGGTMPRFRAGDNVHISLPPQSCLAYPVS